MRSLAPLIPLKPLGRSLLKPIIGGLALLAISSGLVAEKFEVSSGNQQVQLIELFTSEGCSSCPPADRRISKLVNDKELWKAKVPVVFHVDYWDYIGWKDPFAKPEHTRRQSQHKNYGNVDSVYTPAFIIDGKEWRGFFQAFRWPTQKSKQPGDLQLKYNGTEASVTFKPLVDQAKPLKLKIAWLGIGLKTEVKRGENRGKTLPHDFVVLRSTTGTLDRDKGFQSSIPLDSSGLPAAKRYALVAWLEGEKGRKPIQAVGGWISLN